MKLTLTSLSFFGLLIIFLFLFINRVDRRLNLIGQFPDTMKHNYEKYGILGIVGVIICAIIIIDFWAGPIERVFIRIIK